MAKKCSIFLASLLVMAFLVAAASPAAAQGMWKNGRITTSPYEDEYYRIGVDRITYTIVEKAPIYERKKIGEGQYTENPISLSRLRNGDQILFKAQGFRIHQIVLTR